MEMRGSRAFEIVLQQLFDARSKINEAQQIARNAQSMDRSRDAEERRLRNDLEQARKIIKDQGALVARLTTLWKAADAIRNHGRPGGEEKDFTPVREKMIMLDAALEATRADIES